MAKVLTGPESTESGSLSEDFTEGPGIQLTGHPVMQEEEPAPEGEKEEAAAEGDKKPPEKEEPPAKKYKTHEDAEAGAREHQAAFTKKAEEAAQEKTAREAAEAKVADLEAKLAAAKPPEKPAEETKPPTREEQKTRLMSVATAANKKAVVKIRELDRTADDYDEQVAAAWAEANTEALMEAGIGGVSQETIDKMVSEKVKATYQAERDADKATREVQNKKDAEAEATRIEKKAREFGTKAGLELDDPESVDSIVWDRVKTKIPQEVYDKDSLEAQAEWVTAEVRRLTGKVAQTAAEREEAARRHQEENAPLGKGGRRLPDKKPKTGDLGSLGSDFAEVRQQRTIT